VRKIRLNPVKKFYNNAPSSGRCFSRPPKAKLYNYQWQQARLQFLKEHPFCAHCRERGLFVAATVVDHITPHNGDPRLFWDRSNWQPLCKPCHDGWKQKQEAEMFGR